MAEVKISSKAVCPFRLMDAAGLVSHTSPTPYSLEHYFSGVSGAAAVPSYRGHHYIMGQRLTRMDQRCLASTPCDHFQRSLADCSGPAALVDYSPSLCLSRSTIGSSVFVSNSAGGFCSQ